MENRLPISTLKSFEQLLEKAKKIAVVPHVNPDGDAIGSALGLCRFLKNKGFETVVISPNHYPEFLHWMPFNEDVVIFSDQEQKAIDIFNTADLIICVDFNDLYRCDSVGQHILGAKALTIIIDHHPLHKLFGDLIISETSACATAELLYEIMIAMGGERFIDTEVATCLLTGIMTDTGSFNYSSSDPRTFKTVGSLLEKGVDKDAIFSNIYDNYSVDRMRLMGYLLNEKLVYLPEYNTAYVSLSRKELYKHDFQSGDSEGFVNLPLSIKGVKFTAYFMEKKDEIKISFRSKGDFDVNVFSSSHFNGGGHKKAAGGSDKLSLEDTILKFENLLKDYAEELK